MDTIMKNCKICGQDGDCINNTCLECSELKKKSLEELLEMLPKEIKGKKNDCYQRGYNYFLLRILPHPQKKTWQISYYSHDTLESNYIKIEKAANTFIEGSCLKEAIIKTLNYLEDN